MRQDFVHFLALADSDQLDVFETTAERLDTQASYVEKDFWICLVLDTVFNLRPDNEPRLVLKGGTSLSKGFGLINRFSEDIDLVVFREDLGFDGDRDPTYSKDLTNKKRRFLFDQLRSSCSRFILSDLANRLNSNLGELVEIEADRNDPHLQTLLVEYRTLYPKKGAAYIQPQVKLEAGARSALDPSKTISVFPYIQEELDDLSLGVDSIQTITPERTFLEKLLILHGTCCGFRDEKRLPIDRNRISRHYYDVAVLSDTMIGSNALADNGLLVDVRRHNMVAFRSAWKKFEDAVPGKIMILPAKELYEAIEKDYHAMRDMILGEPPEFSWVVEQLARVDSRINISRSE